MNENQKAFLCELAELLNKYNVDSLFTRSTVNRTCVHSNGETLCFSGYQNGKFIGIMTTHGDYEPKRKDSDNE